MGSIAGPHTPCPRDSRQVRAAFSTHGAAADLRGTFEENDSSTFLNAKPGRSREIIGAAHSNRGLCWIRCASFDTRMLGSTALLVAFKLRSGKDTPGTYWQTCEPMSLNRHLDIQKLQCSRYSHKLFAKHPAFAFHSLTTIGFSNEGPPAIRCSCAHPCLLLATPISIQYNTVHMLTSLKHVLGPH